MSSLIKMEQKTTFLSRRLGSVLILLAIFVACSMCLLSPWPVPIQNPPVLVFGALFLLLPFSRNSLNTLQRVAGLYLIAILVNQLAEQFVCIPLLPRCIGVSKSVFVLLFCAIGVSVQHFAPLEKGTVCGEAEIVQAWLLTTGLIVVHMCLLAYLLTNFYGYGAEHDWSVLANCGVYYALFFLLWQPLGEIRLRQWIGLLVLILLLLISLRE
jgi:hypothetical protein